MGKLDGKIALITGGSEGMGFATAQEFIKEGSFVFITGRRKPELEKAVETLGGNAVGIQADAGSLPTWIACLRKSKRRKAGSMWCLQMLASTSSCPTTR